MIPLSVLVALMVMVHTVTGMPTPPLPTINVASKAEAKLANPVGGDILPGGSWKASTDLSNGVITFRHTPDFTKVDDYCALAHELTHYFQWANNVRPHAPTHLEPPAYEVQAICYEKNKEPDSARWARVQATKYLLANE